MDLVMPVMNGAEATRQIMRETPCAILVVTATVSGNFSLVCDALGYGAYDAVSTPSLGAGNARSGRRRTARETRYVDRINRRLGRADSAGTKAGGAPRTSPTLSPPAAAIAAPAKPAATALSPRASSFPLVAIGSSTGGPPALQAILSAGRRFPGGRGDFSAHRRRIRRSRSFSGCSNPAAFPCPWRGMASRSVPARSMSPGRTTIWCWLAADLELYA